jgi:iron complex outermembrane receptor protein
MGFSTEIEAIGTRGWTAGFRGHLGYTYQLTGDLETNTRLTDSPEHLVKFNLSVPFWADRLVASTEAQYTSARASVAPGPGGTLVPGGEAGAFLTWNFSLLAQKLVKGLELSASVYNLLDEKNGDPATLFHAQDLIPQIGRTFWLKVRYQF